MEIFRINIHPMRFVCDVTKGFQFHFSVCEIDDQKLYMIQLGDEVIYIKLSECFRNAN